MRKLKSILSILTIMALILVNTSAIAYSGRFDTDNEITMSEYLVNGKGGVDIAPTVGGYRLYCQANVINSDTYNKIKKLKDEIYVIGYHNLYEESKSEDDRINYEASQEYYKNNYGTYVEDFSDEKVDENQSSIIYWLPDFTDNWQRSMDNSYNIDLASFSGTKDIVVWVQVEKRDGTRIYDAEVYEVTGTKNENVNTNTSTDITNSTISNNTTSTNNSVSNNTNSSTDITNNVNSTNTVNNTTTNTNTTNTVNNTTTNTNTTNTVNNTTTNTNTTNTVNNTTTNTNTTQNTSSNKNENTANKGDSTINKNDTSTNKGNATTKGDNTTIKDNSTSGGSKTTTSSISTKSDKTTSTEKLPYAGIKEKITRVSIVIAVAIAGILFIKYKKIK